MERDIVSESCSCSSILILSKCSDTKKNYSGVVRMDFPWQRLGLLWEYVGCQNISLCSTQIHTVCEALQGNKSLMLKFSIEFFFFY